MAGQFIAGIVAALALVVCVYIVVVRMEAARARAARELAERGEVPEPEQLGLPVDPPVTEAPIPGRVVEIRKRETGEYDD